MGASLLTTQLFCLSHGSVFTSFSSPPNVHFLLITFYLNIKSPLPSVVFCVLYCVNSSITIILTKYLTHICYSSNAVSLQDVDCDGSPQFYVLRSFY